MTDQIDDIPEWEKKDQEILESLKNMNNQSLLERLHTSQIKQLILRLERGEATGSEFQAINQLLKNNNITVNPETDNSLDELQEKIKEAKSRTKKFNASDRDDIMSNVVNFNK